MATEGHWKFYVTMLVAIAGVAIPVWLWQADLDAKALRVEVLSVSSLMPDLPTKVGGIEVTYAGQPIKAPFLTVLEVENGGSKPIASNDFESDLQLHVTNDARIVRAQIASSAPKGLEPKIVVAQRSFSLRPLLLNPGDSVRVSVVTSAGSPRWDARARILGVRAVELAQDTRAANGKPKTLFKGWLAIPTAFFLLVIYLTFTPAAFMRREVIVRWPMSLISGLAGAIGSAIALVPLVGKSGLPLWSEMGMFVLFTAVALFASRVLNPRRRR